MNKDNNFKKLSNIGTALFLIGIIFLFIKAIIGVICIITTFGINVYIAKKYPREFKQIVEGGSAPKTDKMYKLKLVEGLKFFDNNSDVTISMPDKKIILSDGSQTQEIIISDIAHAAILEEITNDVKDKSVVARALVGGLLLGGVGAVVGGLTGVTPSHKKNKKYYLQIKTNSGDDIILTGKTNLLKELKEKIIKNV